MQIRFKDEPFILASQARQVYYVKDVKKLNWHIMVRATPRNFFDIPFKEMNVEDENIVDMKPYQQNELANFIHGPMYTLDDDGDVINLSRDDIEGSSVDADVLFKSQDTVEEENDDTDIDDDMD